MYLLKIKVANKVYEELVFDDTEKEILKLESKLNGLKTVSRNEEDNKYIFNAFEKHIESHNSLVNQIFKTNGDYKIENSNKNNNNELKQEKEKSEINTDDASKPESKEEDDSHKKSDF